MLHLCGNWLEEMEKICKLTCSSQILVYVLAIVTYSLVSLLLPLQMREMSGNTVINFMATCHVMIKSLTHCMTSRFATEPLFTGS